MISINTGNVTENSSQIIMGLNIDSILSILVNDLNKDQKKIYDDFFNLCGNYNSLNIINTPKSLNLNRTTIENVINDIKTIDYNSFNNLDKNKVNKFLELIK